VPRRILSIVACSIALLSHGCGGIRDARGEDLKSAESANYGTIEGTVIYLPDAKRPWRYWRYYVADSKKGELAESVVALRVKGFGKPDADSSATIKMDQKDFQFRPETVAIRQGDAVTFTNGDQTVHNVRSVGGLADFNVNTSVGGTGYTVRFDRAGGIGSPVEIGCVFHSNMRAWVFVFDHPYFAVTQADGRFRFTDVPPGEYDLEMAHPAGSLRWRKRVEVKADEVLRADIRVSPDDKK
jgi:plastocyanin